MRIDRKKVVLTLSTVAALIPIIKSGVGAIVSIIKVLKSKG